MAQKPVSEWTTQDVKTWIMTLSAGQQMKVKACSLADENSVTGADLAAARTGEDISEIGFNRIMANKMFTNLSQKLKTEQQSQQQRISSQQQQQANATQQRLQQLLQQNNECRRQEQQQQNLHNNNNNNNNNDSNGTIFGIFSRTIINRQSGFRVNIIKGNITKQTQGYFHSYTKVSVLKQHIADTEGGDVNKLLLRCNGRPVLDNKTLSECNIDAVNPVTVVFRVRGGSYFDSNNDSNRIRRPDFQHNKNIQPSLDPDCIMGYDEENKLRVKMPCGHVFDPITIFELVKMVMRDHHRIAVQCPMEKCNTEWKLGDIVSAADLNETEKNNLGSVLGNRELLKSGDYKQCPTCKCPCEKPDALYMLRIHCENEECKGSSDFCWICSKSWQGGGFTVCGNKDCHTATVNEDLKNCGTTNKVTSRSDVNCPKVRACPRCLSLVEYEEACKHMKCWNCQKEFCFICLSLRETVDGTLKWKCTTGDSYTGSCPLAPVQVLK